MLIRACSRFQYLPYRTALLLNRPRQLYVPSHLEDKEKLFSYTTGRWLYNENEQNAIRYTKFNVEALAQIACKAVGAHSCVEFAKLDEGSYNKAFRLTFNDSSRAIVRIPCPLAGLSCLVTASEVATLEFAREVLNLPVPRVLTWSGAKIEPADSVGVDYIVMEEIPGVRLGDRWPHFGGPEEVMPALKGILGIETQFESLSFSQIGSLYFKDDVSLELQSRPLLSANMDSTTQRISEKFRVGPLIDYQWWRGERAHMALDRGPWSDATSFFLAAANNEQMFLNQCTSISLRYRRSPTHDVAVHLRLLEMYIKAIPLVLPRNDDLCKPTLWHPDLSLGNIFVSESGAAQIQGIIDWQHAAILPYFSQVSIPPAIIYDGDKINMSGRKPGPLPANIEELSSNEQEVFRLHHRLATRQKWYEANIAFYNKRRSAVTRFPCIEELMMLPTYVVRAWSDGILDLQHALLYFQKEWDKLAPPDTPCPILFSEEEIAEHKTRWDRFQLYQAAVAAINDAYRCEGDGWVAHERYEIVRSLIKGLKGSWNEELTGCPFPYEDGQFSFFLS